MAARAGDNHPLLLSTSTQAWISLTACDKAQVLFQPET